MRSFKKLEYLKYLNNNDDGINDSFYEKEFSNSSIFLRLGGRHSTSLRPALLWFRRLWSWNHKVRRKKERKREGRTERMKKTYFCLKSDGADSERGIPELLWSFDSDWVLLSFSLSLTYTHTLSLSLSLFLSFTQHVAKKTEINWYVLIREKLNQEKKAEKKCRNRLKWFNWQAKGKYF